MLVILLSLIIGFGIARANNTNTLNFILMYSLLSFIIIVFVYQKSCKKCKDKNNKECTIEYFNKKTMKQPKQTVGLMVQLYMKIKSDLKYFEDNKEITQKKKKELCDELNNIYNNFKKHLNVTWASMLKNKHQEIKKEQNVYNKINNFIDKNQNKIITINTIKKQDRKRILNKIKKIVKKEDTIKIVKNEASLQTLKKNVNKELNELKKYLPCVKKIQDGLNKRKKIHRLKV